ncbi:MAG TPA: glutaredoxin family protein [Methylophaga aminisulfidivorans]|uniref:glutaredoxin family protein n=1 Tax=Methylophaga TaxID=40222 RepID=UPI00175072BE|nr:MULTISPECIES: glutaredoxin family protein [Methylophaga]HIC45454.1 glutaredoxin family protein [Methylophaga sp.]HIM40986.1 glutaredoxin family protein [Methylophaga aminisulfidivorans]
MVIHLYTTAGCHLCEQAQELLHASSQAYAIDIKPIEIGDDDKLVEEFGVHIPVVEFPDKQQLFWPFDLTQLNQKIQEQTVSYT